MSNKKRFAFADVQGFRRDRNVFVLKEFCLISDDNEFHELVKSPCQYSELDRCYQRQATYVSYNHHGLKFDTGGITLDELIERTLEHVANKIVLVKGVEKVWWLKQIYGDIKCVNIEDVDCFARQTTNLSEILPICSHHLQFRGYYDCRCALSIARSLRDFMLIGEECL